MEKLKQKLNKLVDRAFTHIGTETEFVNLGTGVGVRIRVSACLWPVEVEGRQEWVKTIDITHIYSDYSKIVTNLEDMELKTANMPKGLGAPVYAAMESICRARGYALRIECVLSPRLRESLISKHGFVLQGHHSGSLFENSVIKVLDWSCIYKMPDLQ